MSAQPAERPHGAVMPMPPITEAALRVAVRRLNLAEAVTYEEEFHAAWEEAVQTDSTMPMRSFLHRWAVWVAVHRHPDRSARMRELEQGMAAAESRDEAREIATRIGQLLDAAASEAGVS